MNSFSNSVEANQDILFDEVRDEIVKVLSPERVLIVYLPRGENDLQVRSRFGVSEERCLDTAGVSLTLIRTAILDGKPLACLDAGDVETSDSLSAVLLGLSSVCLAPIIHPSGLRIGVLYADDRREVARYKEPDAEWLGKLGVELGKKLSSVPKMMVIEPAAELKLPPLPPDRILAQMVTKGEAGAAESLETRKKSAIQQLVDSIEQHRQTGGIRLARLQNELAEVRQREGNFQEAERLLRDCVETMRAAGQSHGPEAIPFMNNLAGVTYRNGDTASAEAMYIYILKGLDEENPDNWNRATPLLWNLGTLYLETGQTEKARAFLSRASRLAEKVWGPEDQRTKKCLERLAQIQYSQVS